MVNRATYYLVLGALLFAITLLGWSCFGQAFTMRDIAWQGAALQPVSTPAGPTLIQSNGAVSFTYYDPMFNWYYVASPFRSTNAMTLSQVSLLVATNGQPNKQYTLTVCANDSGSPGSVIDGGTSATNSATGIAEGTNWWSFTGFTCTLQEDTDYWLRLQLSAYEAGGAKVLWVGPLGKSSSSINTLKHADSLASWTWGQTNLTGAFELWGVLQ